MYIHNAASRIARKILTITTWSRFAIWLILWIDILRAFRLKIIVEMNQMNKTRSCLRTKYQWIDISEDRATGVIWGYLRTYQQYQTIHPPLYLQGLSQSDGCKADAVNSEPREIKTRFVFSKVKDRHEFTITLKSLFISVLRFSQILGKTSIEFKSSYIIRCCCTCEWHTIVWIQFHGFPWTLKWCLDLRFPDRSLE